MPNVTSEGKIDSGTEALLEAEGLGRCPLPERLTYDGKGFARLTHYIFRFPAKFHPPVIRALLDTYTRPGDRILDPFCGSGSLLVEAAVSGRHAVGTDIDPVAVFVSRVKTRRFDIPGLANTLDRLTNALRTSTHPAAVYEERQFIDLPQPDVDAAIAGEELWVPAIPNLAHWFRRYVILDLARLRKQILALEAPEDHRDFLLLCFASIIRAASNADPVPVSGLEVTAYMKQRDEAGRVVDPFALYALATHRALAAVSEFTAKAHSGVEIAAFAADATTLASHQLAPADAVITSPPYHNAVDYYRRHQLEMFWLGLTRTQSERLALLPRYIGRPNVPASHPYVQDERELSPLARSWEARIRQVSTGRANDFRHYIVAMHRTFEQLARVIRPRGCALFVVGHSSWNNSEIPTAALFIELAGSAFVIEEQLWYPIKNRYMSYSRHNGASIEKEYVLVFRRTNAPPG
jgi:SAM-dependent methyltransferase